MHGALGKYGAPVVTDAIVLRDGFWLRVTYQIAGLGALRVARGTAPVVGEGMLQTKVVPYRHTG